MAIAALTLLLSLNLAFYLDEIFLELRALAAGRTNPSPPPATAPRRLAVLVANFRGQRDLPFHLKDDHTLFLGVSGNDSAAWAAARALEQAHAQVMVIVQTDRERTAAWRELAAAVLGSEDATGVRYDGFVLLEGNDSLHPAALPLFAEELAYADLVQLPVLPRAGAGFGAAAYADEAADFARELGARVALGAPLSTRGTGLALSHRFLTRLLAEVPTALAHSYALGVHAHRLGFRSAAPRVRANGALVAAYQDGPESLRWAVRRRARFVFEASVDAHRDFGWGEGWAERYFFWRDRRGLLFAILGLGAALVLLARSFVDAAAPTPLWLGTWAGLNLFLAGARVLLRMRNCAEAFGWARAWRLPFRHPVGNFLFSMSQWRALALARARR